MILEYYSSDLLSIKIKAIIKKYLDLKKCRVFYFGSRVKGTSNKRSDIDLGLDSKEKISAADKFNIIDELENIPILYKIDLVDFSIVSPDFKKEALKNIEYIN